jgi:tetratricopeptide (TPR) repeat protein
LRLVLLSAIVVVSSTAAAGEGGREAAKAHFANGSTAFDLGNYDEAVKEYMAAYAAVPDPLILYNIGQAHRLAGHHREALRFYRTYLARSPEAPNRAEVQTKIGELQKLIDQEGRTQNSPPTSVARSSEDLGRSPVASTTPKPITPPTSNEPSTPPTAQPQPPTETPAPQAEPVQPAAEAAVQPQPAASRPGRTLTIAGAAIGAVGVAALVGGIVSSVLAQQASDKVVSTANSSGTYDPSVQQQGKTAQAAAIALYAIGGAAVATGTVLLVLGQRKKSAAAAMLAPTVGPQYAGAFVQFRF